MTVNTSINLYQVITSIYPNLNMFDFSPLGGTIKLQNDNNGLPTYIAQWNNIQYLEPTQDQLTQAEVTLNANKS